jgi:photosystem II stability/assembly factor-like uncharacterized protein
MKKYIFIILLTFSSITLNAQWQLMSGPYGGNTSCILTVGSYVLAGTKNNGIFLSTNNGGSWTPANNGLTSANIYMLAYYDSVIYTATYTGVYTSSDYGSSWTRKGTLMRNFSCFFFIDSTIYVGDRYDGIYKTTKNDTSWMKVNHGIGDTCVNTITRAGNYLYAGTTHGGVFRSSDHGASWNAINNGITQYYINSLFYDGTTMYAGASCGKLFTSADLGDTWIQANNGLSGNAMTFAMNGSYVYAATWNTGVYRTNNHGASWTTAINGLTNGWITGLTLNNSSIFVSTEGDGVFFSNNSGNSWAQVNNGLVGTDIFDLEKIGDRIIAVSVVDNLFISDNDGASWEDKDITSQYISHGDLFDLAVADSMLYLGRSTSLLSSADSGNSWSEISTIPLSHVILINDTDILLGTHNQGVQLSHDQGATWTILNPGMLSFNNVSALFVFGNKILDVTGNYEGIYSSDDYGLTWHYCGMTGTITTSMVVHKDKLFAGVMGYGIFVSQDTGEIWQNVFAGQSIGAMASNDTVIIASRYNNNDLLVSADDGYTWYPVDNDSLKLPISVLKIYGSFVYAATYGRGIWRRPLADLLSNIIVSVPENVSDQRISIFPNPANSQISIETNRNTMIEILNINGQIIKSCLIPEGRTALDISEYSKGMYFIKATTDEGTIVEKFIKQ